MARTYQPVVRVPTATLREAFDRCGMTAAEVAAGMDWWTARGAADGDRVKRALGMRLEYSGSGRPAYPRRTVPVEIAGDLVRAMGQAPVDFGF